MTIVATCEDFPVQLLRRGSKSSPLIIRKAEPSTADLLPQNAIFLDQIVNDLVLSLVQPTRKGNDKKRKWIQTGSHPRSLTRVAALLALKTHGWIFGHYEMGHTDWSLTAKRYSRWITSDMPDAGKKAVRALVTTPL